MRYLMCLLLVGCASTPTLDPNYVAYLESMERIERNRAEAFKAKYNAQAENAKAAADIARNGGETTKSLAVVSLTRGEYSGEPLAQQQTSIALPVRQEGWEEKALRWASALSSVVNPWIGGYFGYRLGTEQSRNSREVAIAQNNAFASVATSGFNSNAQIAASGFGATTTGFTAIRDVAINGKPNITVTNGAVSTGAGNASYTQTTTTNSHNRTCISGAAGNGAPGGSGGQGTTTGGAGGSGGVGGASGQANC